MSSSYEVKIRPECFLPADEGWQRPSGPEVQEIVRRVGMSGRGVARLLGLSEHGGRQVRRHIQSICSRGSQGHAGDKSGNCPRRLNVRVPAYSGFAPGLDLEQNFRSRRC